MAAMEGWRCLLYQPKKMTTLGLQSVISKGLKEIVGKVIKMATDHMSRNKHTLYEEWK